DGKPAGASFHAPDRDGLAQLAREGITYGTGPNNGEPVTPTQFSDGRVLMRSDYEIAIVDYTDQNINAWFPQGREVYVVNVNKKQAAKLNTFKMGKNQLAVFSSLDAIPKEMRPGAI